MWDGGRGNIVRAVSKTDPCLEYITSLKSEELKGNWENCLKRERQLSPKTAFGKQFQAHIPNYLFLSFLECEELSRLLLQEKNADAPFSSLLE